jgi:hypothetical protein
MGAMTAMIQMLTSILQPSTFPEIPWMITVTAWWPAILLFHGPGMDSM